MMGFQQAKTYFSVKHSIYGLQWQVVTRRDGVAVHVTSGFPSVMHDPKLFGDTVTSLEALIAAHPGNPCTSWPTRDIIGATGSPSIILYTPVKNPVRGVLTQEEATFDKTLSKQRVVVENVFGRLQNKFRTMVRRWHFTDAYYETVFQICCALTNFDVQAYGGTVLRAGDGQFYQQNLTRMIQENEGKQRIEPADAQ
jgi:hypothetical protein